LNELPLFGVGAFPLGERRNSVSCLVDGRAEETSGPRQTKEIEAYGRALGLAQVASAPGGVLSDLAKRNLT
jgi:hypothetical protein